MISVVMAYYHQRDYIRRAVESVLTQTYQNFDLFIANDSDSDEDLLEDLAKLDGRISWFMTHDVGGVQARTQCIQKSTQDYFVPLDPDDSIHPTFLERTYKELAKRTQYGFCYTDSLFWEGDTARRMMQPDYNFFNLLQNNYICYCSLIRRKAWNQAGGYNQNNFNFFEDYEAWIRLGRKGIYGYHLAEPLFNYFITTSGMTGKTADKGTYYKAFLIRWYPELYPQQWQAEVDRILEGIPSNFMSLKPAQQDVILEELKKTKNL